MTKKYPKQESQRPRQRDGTSRASAILAAVSLLSVSLGVTDAAAADNVGSVTGLGQTAASNMLAQAKSGGTAQNALQRNQIKRQVLPSNQPKSQDLQLNRSKRQLTSGRGKGCKRYHC